MRTVGAAVLAATMLMASLAAQIRLPRFGEEPPAQEAYEATNVPYDGHFVFVRLQYPSARGELGSSRGAPWAHDYPRAERNFAKILKELTYVQPYMDGGNVLGLEDPELFQFPVAYMSEPGFWRLTDQQAAALRAYLRKGGFVIFDDFRGWDWDNFAAQMKRVLPDGRLIELDVSNPIFHAFFEIETLDFVQLYDRGGKAIFYGVFEDNDPRKRLMLVANYNNDIGEYWEYSDTGFVPVNLSNEAYKLGVNYVIYAMTH